MPESPRDKGDAGSAGSGNQAKPDFRQTQLHGRLIQGNAVMTGECQFISAAESQPARAATTGLPHVSNASYDDDRPQFVKERGWVIQTESISMSAPTQKSL